MNKNKLYKEIDTILKRIEKNKEENSRLYNKLKKCQNSLSYELQSEAKHFGFKEGAKVRILTTKELPKHLQRRRKNNYWKDINGIYTIDFMYVSGSTGYPHIDDDKPELIVHLKEYPITYGPIRLSDITLIK